MVYKYIHKAVPYRPHHQHSLNNPGPCLDPVSSLPSSSVTQLTPNKGPLEEESFVDLIKIYVSLLQVPQQSLQPASFTLRLEAAEAAAQANVEVLHRPAIGRQMGQPSSHRQKNSLAPGGRPVHSPTGSLIQAQKQHLLFEQTQQIRQQSQQVLQQLSQQQSKPFAYLVQCHVLIAGLAK